MKKIIIPAGVLPRGYYAREVALSGHLPGVLSGAALEGRAAQYGSWYRSQRARVIRALEAYGVRPERVGPNRSIVWALDGLPVQVLLEERSGPSRVRVIVWALDGEE